MDAAAPAARGLRARHGLPGAGRRAAARAHARQAAALLSLRHAGITLALVVLAPIVAAELDDQVQLARERGTALVLDAALPPTDKIELAPRLFANLETEDPRDALAQSLARERHRITTGDRDLLSRLQRLDRQLGGGGKLLDRLEQLEDSYGSTLDEAAQRARPACSAPTAPRGCSTTCSQEAEGDSSRRSSWERRSTSSATISTTSCWRPSTPPSARRSRSPAAMALLAALLLLFRLGSDPRPARGPPRRGADRGGARAGGRRAGRLRDRRVQPRARAGPDRRPVQDRASAARSGGSRAWSRASRCAGSTGPPAASAPRARSWCWRCSTTSRGATTSASTASTRASSTSCSKGIIGL